MGSYGARSAVSFGGAELASRPAINFVLPGHPAPPACPGTAADPQAASGNLCVYIVDWAPNEVRISVQDPSQTPVPLLAIRTGTGVTTQSSDGRASRFGFDVLVSENGSSNEDEAWGTWAVTG